MVTISSRHEAVEGIHPGNAALIGREDVNDLAAILSVVNHDHDASHEVGSSYDTHFTWDYEKAARPRLDRLDEKAKTSQWNGQTDLPWHLDVDPEAVVAANRDAAEANGLKIVETVPWIDIKYYAATQVVDEARHVEVFSKYLQEKLAGAHPINAHLRMLLDDIIADRRWDMTYLGMQIMVEGLALAAFGFLHHTTTEPLLEQLLRYMMADEARHVAFGVLSLQELYAGLTSAALWERKEHAYEAAVRMRDRLLQQQEVWERLGVPVHEAMQVVSRSPERQLFQRMLFAKIVPNCKKLGLPDNGDRWLRDRFTELGVIELETCRTPRSRWTPSSWPDGSHDACGRRGSANLGGLVSFNDARPPRNARPPRFAAGNALRQRWAWPTRMAGSRGGWPVGSRSMTEAVASLAER